MAKRDIEKNAVNAARLSLIAVLLLAGACRRDETIGEPNRNPRAVAKVNRIAGQPVENFTAMDGTIAVPFDGTPVEVELDASDSTDMDGVVTTYRWLSGTPGPDGKGRFVPEGEDQDWPADDVKPTVVLDERKWTFTLWVQDDEGAISEPDQVTLTVGDPPDPMMGGDTDGGTAVDPAVVAECVGTVFSGVDDACKECLCSLDETCRAAVAETACNDACWALIRCVGANCPNFAEMAAMMDYSCLTANCMAELTAGGTGATAAGMCVRMCPDACTAM